MPAEIRGPSWNSPSAWPTGLSPPRTIPVDPVEQSPIRSLDGALRTPGQPILSSLETVCSNLKIHGATPFVNGFLPFDEHCNNARHCQTQQLARNHGPGSDGTPRYGIAQGGMPRFDFAFYRQLYSSNSAVSRLPAVQPFWWFERLILTDPEGIGGKK